MLFVNIVFDLKNWLYSLASEQYLQKYEKYTCYPMPMFF